MDSFFRRMPELLVVAAALWAQWRLAFGFLGKPAVRRCRWAPHAIRGAGIAATVWLSLPFLYLHPGLRSRLAAIDWIEWLKGLCLVWSAAVLAAWLTTLRPGRWAFSPARRRFLGIAQAALVAGPAAAAGFGYATVRRDFRVREIQVPVPGLPADLDGVRIVQLSDLHRGPFLDGRDLERVVAMANETRAHLAVVTGDLITLTDSLLEDCLQRLQALRAEAGVLGCFGNHEYNARCEARAQRLGARVGIRFLRAEAERLRFGSALLNIAGVDYQRRSGEYLRGAEKLLEPGAVNILLSHNPDVFPAAARQGWHLTLAGHTHGGQITLGVLAQHLNPARIFTPFVYGLYRRGASALYVTSGIGCVGVPVRIGAYPEVALIRLCAT